MKNRLSRLVGRQRPSTINLMYAGGDGGRGVSSLIHFDLRVRLCVVCVKALVQPVPRKDSCAFCWCCWRKKLACLEIRGAPPPTTRPSTLCRLIIIIDQLRKHGPLTSPRFGRGRTFKRNRKNKDPIWVTPEWFCYYPLLEVQLHELVCVTIRGQRRY